MPRCIDVFQSLEGLQGTLSSRIEQPCTCDVMESAPGSNSSASVAQRDQSLKEAQQGRAEAEQKVLDMRVMLKSALQDARRSTVDAELELLLQVAFWLPGWHRNKTLKSGRKHHACHTLLEAFHRTIAFIHAVASTHVGPSLKPCTDACASPSKVYSYLSPRTWAARPRSASTHSSPLHCCRVRSFVRL